MGLTESWALQLVLVGVATYLLVRVVRWWLWYRSFFAFFNGLPGETDFHWFWGNMHKLSHDTEERMKYTRSLLEKYPRFYRMWVGPFKAVISVCHPDTVKLLLKTAEPKPVGFGGFYQYALPWLGRGLLLADGARWSRSRRLLTPAFHFDILKPYVHVYNQCADVLLEKIDKHAAKGEYFELFGNVSLCTLDIILRCAMSYQDNIQTKGESHPYVQAVTELSELWSKRARQPLYSYGWLYFNTKNGRRFLELCKYVHSVADDVINRRRRSLQENPVNSSTSGKRFLDFLDILLTARDEQGQGLSHEEIRNEVDTFLFEGHDTTASGISWTLYSLAAHPEYQRRVQEELDSVLAGRENPEIQLSDLGKLEFLTNCIKEGLRLRPPVPFIQRELTKDTQIDGHTIPAGTSVTIHLMHLHHHPEVWPDPWTFNPDRFTSGRADTETYGYVPFSAGPRNCIGQNFAMNEEKVILARTLHKYTLEVDPNHEVKMKISAVMRSEKGIKIIAKPRLPAPAVLETEL